jgi:PKD repeat protein
MIRGSSARLLRHLPAGSLLVVVAGLLPGPGTAAAQGPCGPPVVNAVACENTQPGNPASEWDIIGAGSPSIQGFATDISVDQGGTVHFKVNTDATNYRIDIYRLGYYNGAGARFVATVEPSVLLPQAQPQCLTDAASGLVDCGTWSESASWTVPATATSGVYIAKLVREDGVTGASHIVFVVRDDDGSSDLLFQTSDTTWQAYNDYGGNSLYVGGPGTAPGRAYKVSYNRPFVTRGNIFGRGWLFGPEYPMIRWLEANGFDVSYSTGVDTARRGAELLEHKVFLSVGHDEYWSAEQRANVEAARDAGVHLAFFSGNEMFWKTRWEASIDGSGTPYRTLVAYKETHANAKIDPVPGVWTGTWRDPRFSPPADGGRPENAVTGTLFMVNCCRQDAITIPEPLGKLRFWRNTSVATLQPGQTATLPAGVLGYEWDEAPANGVAPDGLVRLSSSTVTVSQYLTDYGSSFANAAATHSVTLYRHPSGALVFGAGTIRWSWGLDGTHDQDPMTPGATTTPDGRMQQATINLFADMGVQPATLQPGLVPATESTDTTAPTSTIVSPASGSATYPGIPLTISGTASDAGGGTVAAVEVSVDGGVTWHPATGLGNWSYTWIPQAPGPATIVSSAIDDSGNIELPQSGVTIDVQIPPPDFGRVAAYSFDTDGGTSVTDISGNGHTGTVSGSTWSPDGKFGGALAFDGVDDWVTVADSALLDLTSGMTLSAWVYPTAGGGYREVLIKEAPGSEAYNLYASSEANVPVGGVVLGQNPILAVSGTQSLPLNAWSHLALTFDSATLRLYVNGALAGSQAASGSIATSSGALRFGGNSIWGEFFAGRIDEIRIYNRALVADEIATIMNTPIGSSVNQPPTAVAQATPTSGLAPLTVAFDGTGSTDPDPGDSIVAYAWDFDGDGAHDDAFVAQPQFTYGAVGTYSVTLRVTDDRGASSVSNPVVISVTAPPPTCPCSLWDSGATPVILADSDPGAVELGVKFQSDVAGYITGLRFYKGPGNTGPHRGNLWTSTGTLLATVTFSDETASGWQAAPLPAAVAISANTTYIASYHAPAGHYSADVGYFASAYANPPLRAPATGAAGGNGVFRYGPSSFPTQPANGTNYWVDVVFNTTPGPADTTPPTVTAVSPGGGASAVGTGTTVTATFSEPVDPATIGASTFQLRDSANALVAAAVTYDAATHTATLQPSAPLAWATTYTARLAGGTTDPRVKDLAGNALAADYAWSFTTAAAPTCPCSIWDSATTPAILADPDPSAIELGVKFRTDVDGFITAIRFYKDTTNTGPHVGRLWTSTGTLLASVTFTGETASGWQQATFPSPVPVTANTTYVASYHAPAGHFSADAAYFTAAGVDNPPLHALANGADGGNGVFLYGSGGFPSQSVNGNNYWVDVVFTLTAPPADTTPPSVTAVSPADGAIGVNPGTSLSATFSEALDPATISGSTFELRDSSTAVVPATVTYDAATRTATLDPTATLENGTTYTATIRGGTADPRVKDAAGNPMAADYTWSFTTTAAPVCPCSLWDSGATPVILADSDPGAVELGVKFQSDVAGYITGLRFYKGPGNTGPHRGNLWTSTGTLLATVTFSDETASGWQAAPLPAAVAISANTTYIASYHAPAGHYSADVGYFASAYANPPLRAPATGAAGGNGVFRYGPSSFPTQPANGTNYWVDVVFNTTPGPADTTPPTVTAVSPGGGASAVGTGTTVTATFSEPVDPATIGASTFQLRDSANALVAAAVTYDAATHTATLQPSAPLAWATTYTARLAGGTTDPRVKDLAGNALAADYAWSFTTAAAPTCPCSIWDSATTPAILADPDPSAIELGVKFRTDVDGFITAIRFYKDTTNTGPHVGRLWTSTGTLLASVTFTGETASGWQQATFPSPVPVTANTTYVASYHAPAGHFSADAAYFTAAGVDNPPLHALANGADGGNGVFLYGSGGFPSQSVNGNNYWVDVVFTLTAPPADTTPPSVTAVAPANGATGVGTSTVVTVTFDEDMAPSTITADTLELRDQAGALVASTVTYDAATRTASLAPSSPLAGSTSYMAAVKGGTTAPVVTDLAGNALTSTVTWGFTTAATVATGFTESVVFSGLSEPTAVRFASDGRVFVAEKSGLIKVFASLSATTPTIFADLRTQTHNFWDRGLLDLELDPDFPVRPYVYVLYTYDAAIGETAPRWGTPGSSSDGCPDPPGATTSGCVASGRLSRLEAAGSVMTGQEQVLIEGWGVQYPSHSVGSLAFGEDGALYVSGGDGASFTFVDYGQAGDPPNPLGDPPVPVGGAQAPPTAQGGALRSQSPRRGAGDPVLLNGAVLRVDPDTGAALPDNPLFSSPDPNARRIVGYGFRNPFRIALRPGTPEIWVGDVGWSDWEEINVIRNPLGATVANFGWPCYEGMGRQAGYEAAGLTMCATLYTQPTAVTAPFFTYHHAAPVVNGETCSVGSSAITGLAFYRGGTYPAFYDGALFFTDYARGCIWVMFENATGVPDPGTRAVFRSGAASPVDLQIGPGGDLFYADIVGGTIRRIRFSAGNQPPTAVLQGQPLSGDAPLTVSFSGASSTDPDPGDSLTYSWDLDGDGVFGDSTAAAPVFTYNASGNYIVRLRVTDNKGASDTASVVVSAGNSPPTAVIDAPAPDAVWEVGQSMTFAGHATDPQQGMLPAAALSWTVIIHHCPSNCHTHTVESFPGVAGGAFTAPDHDYPSQLELVLTATDAQGLQSTASLMLNPRAVVLSFESSPSGLQLAVGPSTSTTPFTRTVIVGSSNSISAPSPQTLGSSSYTFTAWSDGGAQTHNIVAGAAPVTYTATYAVVLVPFSVSDTTATDFGGGTIGTGTYLAQTGDGEVILAPTVGAEFSGSALPQGWSVTAWATGGTGTVSGGALTVNGARVRTTTQYGPGRSLEFVATFGGATNQDVGFGLTLNESPWAVFSTRPGAGLWASTRNAAGTTNTSIPGTWFGAPHRFGIDWTTMGVVYSIDGTVVATHSRIITASMRPLVSDGVVGGGTVVADWLRMTPFATSGTFTSRVFDGGSQATWNTVSWTSSLPAGTSLAVSVRSGNTSTPNSTWTAFASVPASGTAINATARYIQYRAVLSTTNSAQTPVLQDITISGVH